MSTTNGYCTLAELRSSMGITDATDVTDDAHLERAIEAASRAIDDECGRRFFLDSSATARYYTAEDGDHLRIDDVGSSTSFAVATDSDGDRTYESTWAATDYDMLPDNASVKGLPWTALEVTPNGVYSFPTVRRGCKITAYWGWPAVPKPIKSAAIIQAMRYFKRKDAIFGVMGTAETGQMVLPALDPDVKRMNSP